jgi:hypothetical protein
MRFSSVFAIMATASAIQVNKGDWHEI